MIWIPEDDHIEKYKRNNLKGIMKLVQEYQYVDDIYLDYKCDLISYDSCMSLLSHYIYRKERIEFIKYKVYDQKRRMVMMEMRKRIKFIKSASVRKAHSITQA